MSSEDELEDPLASPEPAGRKKRSREAGSAEDGAAEENNDESSTSGGASGSGAAKHARTTGMAANASKPKRSASQAGRKPTAKAKQRQEPQVGSFENPFPVIAVV